MVSRSGEVDTSWQGSVLVRDIADVKRLRDEDGPNLLILGSTELVHSLRANDLVDAMTIFTFPVVLGGGKTLFADGSAPGAYKLFAWDNVDTNAVIFDPDFLRPYEASGQNVEVSSNETKSVMLKLIVNDQK